MGTVPFGQFSLIDLRGDDAGVVVIAPEHIFLRRSRSAAIHDLSYMVVWSGARTAAVRRELQTLAGIGRTPVDATTPELRHVLQAIEPKATPMFQGAGSCRRFFARRQLKAALESPAGASARKTAS